MLQMRNPTILWIVPVLSAVCLVGLPAQAKYAGGTGEPNDPYRIATAADLILLGDSPTDYSRHFILTADIDLDPNLPGRKVFGRAVIAPDTDPSLDFDATAFSGVLDGNGHTISHLVIRGGWYGYLGLFGYLESGAEVRDLGVVDVNISRPSLSRLVLVGISSDSVSSDYSTRSVNSTGAVGGLAAVNEGSVWNSYSTGSVSSANHDLGGLVGLNSSAGSVWNSYSTCSVSGTGAVGGLVGSNSGSVSNSCSTSSVNGTGAVGGLVGSNWGSISNSRSTGPVSGTGNYVGGLVGYNVAGSVLNSCSIGSVSSTGAVGGLVGFNESGSVSNSFWDMTTSGRNKSYGGTGLTTAQMQDPNTFLAAGWDFLGERANGVCEIWLIPTGRGYPELSVLNGYVPPLLNGSGTPDDPYIVETPEDLGTVWYRPTACYRLASDVDLSGMVWSMALVPAFAGRFDGQGHRIRNMTISGGGYLGLFGSLALGAAVSDLGLENVNIVGTGDYVGAMVGHNRGAVSNSSSGGSVSGTYCVGGLMGYNRSSVSNSHSVGSVTGTDAVGGLVGLNYSGFVSNSYSTGSVSGGYEVGGLVGHNDSGSVSNSYAMGSVSGTYWDVGGLVGRNDYHGCVSSSSSQGSVSGKYDVGGLVGTNAGPVSNSCSTSSVTGGQSLGGLVGCNWDRVSSSYSTGSLSGTGDHVGGLVGYNCGSVSNSFWDVTTSGATTSYGGTGLTTTQMQDPNTFLAAGWDLLGERTNGVCEIWLIPAGRGYPGLCVPNGHVPPLLNGAGNPDDPYVVETPEDLGTVWYRPTACYRLASDVDLAGMVWSTAVIPTFSGRLDGQGHRVRNMTISGGGYLGLFGSLMLGAAVSDLGLQDVNVVGTDYYVGGLAGKNSGSVSCSLVAGSVSGTYYVGGLVGHNNSGSVSNSYAMGSVSGTGEYVGGLVGHNDSGSVSNSYATGSVSGTHYWVGGLVGFNWGSVLNSFWDMTTSGSNKSDGGTGLSTAEMQTASTFLEAGWDFVGETQNGTDDIWEISEGKDYPRLWWELNEQTSGAK